MQFDEYKARVLTTESELKEGALINRDVLMHLLLSIDLMCGALDKLKKMTFYNQQFDANTLTTLVLGAQEEITKLLMALNEPATSAPAPQLDGVRVMRLLHSLVGCVGEAGELANVGVTLLEGGPVDKPNLLEEWGDFRWYKALGFDELGFTEEQEAETNIKKLEKRYGGSFSVEKAMNRDLGAERTILEDGVNGNKEENYDATLAPSYGENEHSSDCLGEDQ